MIMKHRCGLKTFAKRNAKALSFEHQTWIFRRCSKAMMIFSGHIHVESMVDQCFTYSNGDFCRRENDGDLARRLIDTQCIPNGIDEKNLGIASTEHIQAEGCRQFSRDEKNRFSRENGVFGLQRSLTTGIEDNDADE